MAVTLYSGPPGAGKSYALIEQVIVPGVLAGRRVLTNIDGVDPDKVWRYCVDRTDEPSRVGKVLLFDGREATESGFFPTESIPDAQTFVKGGDLLVFDEWRLYWPRRGKLPTPDLEAFLRWHRHLVSPDGVACDVVIGTQLATDVHQDFRGLIERSYKFKKLKAIGLSKAYAWDAYEGHLQPKGGAYQTGNGTYKPDIFALYKSYSSEKGATELQTDSRTSIFQRSLLWLIGFCIVLTVLGAWGVYRFFTGSGTIHAPKPAPGSAPVSSGAGVPPTGVQQPASNLRIVGYVSGEFGGRVIVSDGNALRVLTPDKFQFDGGRPVSGFVDGRRVVAEDRISQSGPALFPRVTP